MNGPQDIPPPKFSPDARTRPPHPPRNTSELWTSRTDHTGVQATRYVGVGGGRRTSTGERNTSGSRLRLDPVMVQRTSCSLFRHVCCFPFPAQIHNEVFTLGARSGNEFARETSSGRKQLCSQRRPAYCLSSAQRYPAALTVPMCHPQLPRVFSAQRQCPSSCPFRSTPLSRLDSKSPPVGREGAPALPTTCTPLAHVSGD